MLAGAVLLIAALSLVLWNWHESNHGGESAEKKYGIPFILP